MNPGQRRPVKEDEDLINERVRFPEVLLISDKGEQLGKMSSKEAYLKAVEAQLDLFCVAPNANPPVCKLVNYSKYKYDQQKKAKENKKKQKIVELKEIQLTPQIGQHDLETKAKAARKFLEEGNRIKLGVRFKGRQMSHIEVGQETMDKFIALVEDVATIEKQAAMDGRWLIAILASKVKK